MGVKKNCQVASVERATASHLGDETALLREFVALGIDDLAKYHIVRLCYECPDLAGDAASYAVCLGFHSVAITRALLDELVVFGVLTKVFGQGLDRGTYRLTDDGEARRRLVRLYGATCEQAGHDSLLRLLAARSLKTARKRAMAADADVRAHILPWQVDPKGAL